MRKLNCCRNSLSIGLWAFCDAISAGCGNLPPMPDYGEGAFTLLLPGTITPET
jgi:hypothetical protein